MWIHTNTRIPNSKFYDFNTTMFFHILQVTPYFNRTFLSKFESITYKINEYLLDSVFVLMHLDIL